MRMWFSSGHLLMTQRWVRTHGCREDAAVNHIEAFSSPDVEILPNYTVLLARAHLVRSLHMRGCDDGFVCDEAQVLLDQRCLITLRSKKACRASSEISVIDASYCAVAVPVRVAVWFPAAVFMVTVAV
jgi:hypothetical protein